MKGKKEMKGNGSHGFISSRLRRLSIISSAALGLLLVMPVGSPGLDVAGIDLDKVTGDVTKSLGLGGGGDSGSAPSSSGSGSSSDSASSTGASRAGVPPNYQPPLHGDNPHGQGDVATVELGPNIPATNPYPGDPAGPELLVVGRSKGEQNPDGSYHGHITIAALGGNELLGVDTNEGQTESSPLDPLNDQVLNQICTGSGGQVCLGILTADSSTTGNGSTNHFSVANAQVGPPGSGIGVTAGETNGNISDDGTCQTATGTSEVANANVAGGLTAQALNGSSTSTACNNGAQSTTNDSEVINLNDNGVPVPAAGCADGTPNTNFTPLLPLLGAVCNADDPGTGGQAGTPYGVREALTVFALAVGGNPVLKATTAGPESRAVAPTAADTPGGPGTGPPLIGPGGGGGGNDNGNPDRTVDDANVPGAAAEAAAGGSRDDLAFTGADLLLLGLFGCGILAAGLMLSLAVRQPQTS